MSSSGFSCTKSDEMNYELMAERTRYLKENPKGVSEMCQIMEDMRDESLREGMEVGMKKGIKKGMRETAMRMLSADRYAPEEIADISGLSLDEVEELRARLAMQTE